MRSNDTVTGKWSQMIAIRAIAQHTSEVYIKLCETGTIDFCRNLLSRAVAL